MFPREIVLSLLAVALFAFPAQAADLKFFSSVILAPSSQFYFILPDQPTPTTTDPLNPSFTIDDATLYAYDSQGGFYPTTDDITFYDLSQGGGFSITKGYTGMGIRYFGSQLFGGTLDAPAFAPAVFELTNDYFPASNTLTITPVSPIPEPAVWTMMILGFGAVGYALRGRRHRARSATALA